LGWGGSGGSGATSAQSSSTIISSDDLEPSLRGDSPLSIPSSDAVPVIDDGAPAHFAAEDHHLVFRGST
jgi:hypothetical protein